MYFVGIRASWNDMKKSLGNPPSCRSGSEDHLRTVAMNKGIKKTEKGKKLFFYSVSKADVQTLKKDPLMNPLVTYDDGETAKSAWLKVENKYPSRMYVDSDEWRQFKLDVAEALSPFVEIVGEDIKPGKPRKSKLQKNEDKSIVSSRNMLEYILHNEHGLGDDYEIWDEIDDSYDATTATTGWIGDHTISVMRGGKSLLDIFYQRFYKCDKNGDMIDDFVMNNQGVYYHDRDYNCISLNNIQEIKALFEDFRKRLN